MLSIRYSKVVDGAYTVLCGFPLKKMKKHCPVRPLRLHCHIVWPPRVSPIYSNVRVSRADIGRHKRGGLTCMSTDPPSNRDGVKTTNLSCPGEKAGIFGTYSSSASRARSPPEPRPSSCWVFSCSDQQTSPSLSHPAGQRDDLTCCGLLEQRLQVPCRLLCKYTSTITSISLMPLSLRKAVIQGRKVQSHLIFLALIIEHQCHRILCTCWIFSFVTYLL